jgi:Ca2+-transporting ATPase
VSGELRRLLEAGALCANATLGEDGREDTGDPMELALLKAARLAGIERTALLARLPEVREEAFETETKMMATVHRDGERFLVAVKGAPEAVLAHASRVAEGDASVALDGAQREDWSRRVEELGQQGIRVLGLASAECEKEPADVYSHLTLLGMAGLADPPRADVAQAIEACGTAGIKVVMVTGDHRVTAAAIAKKIGLSRAPNVIEGRDLRRLEREDHAAMRSVDVFARVTPADKLDLVAAYQAVGEVVAMTGDGVNDAPALKKADIGIAMGRRGTDVAREAAAMVLRDDAFPTIVAAIREGRVIFDNIRRVTAYLLSCNLSEVVVVGLAVLSGLPLPLLPMQILYLNLVTDVFPALALAAGEGERNVLSEPPRDPKEPLLSKLSWVGIVAQGLTIAAATLGAFELARNWLGLAIEESITVSFLTLAFAQLWHVFNMRDARSHWLANQITMNGYIWGALGICTALLLAATYTPLAAILRLVPATRDAWCVVIAMSLAPLLIWQIIKASRARGRVR